MKPYPKYDEVLGRELSPSERVEPFKARLRFSIKYAEQMLNRLYNISDDVTEEQLEEIGSLIDAVYTACHELDAYGH